ncbi:MAG: hypothetical protein U5N26_10620 [Candidatus Marinimicrobia bacterium]|nr:hypothetical protein [Candidatus Neomarinimicrobiota bacterium]
MWRFVERTIKKVENPKLLALLHLLIINNRSRIVKHPASLRQHHAVIGGLLEHLVYMLNLVLRPQNNTVWTRTLSSGASFCMTSGNSKP